MSGKPRAVAIALACVIQAACEPATDPLPVAPRQLVVQGVLDLGTQNQIVSVEWTESGTGGLDEVTGATVSITTPDGTAMRATEDVYIRTGFGNSTDSARWNGMYRVDLQKHGVALVPGVTYTLDVRAPDGTHASGTTTIPLISSVSDDVRVLPFDRRRDTLRLSWPKVPGAKSYQVAVRTYLAQFETESASFYTIFVDTSVTIAGTARTLDDDPVFGAGLRAVVVVSAVDDNYYTFFHPTVDPFAGAPPSRLNGGIGMFGSIAPMVIRRYDVR